MEKEKNMELEKLNYFHRKDKETEKTACEITDRLSPW